MLLCLLFTWFAPDLSRLGADDWATREAETARLSNPLSALWLPWRHYDPEIEFRAWEIKRKQLRNLSHEYRERVTYRDDYEAWFRDYFEPGRSRIAEADVWADLIANTFPESRRQVFRGRWGEPPLTVWVAWFGFPGTLADFREYCDYHRGVSPEPRAK
jgi:hypothetical protein